MSAAGQRDLRWLFTATWVLCILWVAGVPCVSWVVVLCPLLGLLAAAVLVAVAVNTVALVGAYLVSRQLNRPYRRPLGVRVVDRVRKVLRLYSYESRKAGIV